MIINKLRKSLIPLFFLFIIYSCESKIEVNCSDLTLEEGLVKLNDKNFTGKCFTYFFDSPEFIDEERSYKNGLMHGKWMKNHRNGNLYYTSNARNGEIHGRYLSYHSNGNLADQGNLKNGYKDGYWEYFDENGRLYKTELYRNKTLINEENY